jgi:hypothetical protein
MVLAHAAESTSGHPTWHFAAVAGLAVVVFLAINAMERWRAHRARRSTPHAPDRLSPHVLRGVAVASAAAGGFHALAYPSHARESAVVGALFVVAALLQLAWAAAVELRPSRATLLAGAGLNGVIAVLWVLSRTAGLPDAEPVGLPDGITTALEVLVVAGVGLAVRTSAPKQPVRPATDLLIG